MDAVRSDGPQPDRPEDARFLALWFRDPASLPAFAPARLRALADEFDRRGASPLLAHLPEEGVPGFLRWSLAGGGSGSLADAREYASGLPPAEPTEAAKLRAELELEARYVLTARQLRRLLRTHGLTQERLAARLGKRATATVWRELAGFQLPNPQAQSDLCAIFHLDYLGPHPAEVKAYAGYVALHGGDDEDREFVPPWDKWLSEDVNTEPARLPPHFLEVLAYAALRWVRLGPGALRLSDRETLDRAARLLGGLPACGPEAAATFPTAEAVLRAAHAVAGRLGVQDQGVRDGERLTQAAGGSPARGPAGRRPEAAGAPAAPRPGPGQEAAVRPAGRRPAGQADPRDGR